MESYESPYESPKKGGKFSPGSSAFALLCGAIGLAVCILALVIGFWKTLLLVVFFAIGWVIGKTGIVQRLIALLADRIQNR